jgi:acetyl-CoA carboxylase carboxyltransferase component
MVGSKAERGGIIRNGAKLINAVSNSTVPHIVLMVGASYGAGNYGMAGKAYDPRFIFTWPNHRIAVMGGRQLAGVMDIVARNAAAGRGIEVDEAELDQRKAALEAQIESESSALYSTGRVWDDGIIHPNDTRHILTMALSVTHSAEVRGATEYGVWRH